MSRQSLCGNDGLLRIRRVFSRCGVLQRISGSYRSLGSPTIESVGLLLTGDISPCGKMVEVSSGMDRRRVQLAKMALRPEPSPSMEG
jgi:hypothetical protein